MRYFILLGAFIIGLIVFPGTHLSALNINRLSGSILLQVESKGEAWYVDPASKKRVYLGRPADAFEIMRSFGLGITDADLKRIAEFGEQRSSDESLARRLEGKILLQVQSRGEAWYVNPINLKRYFLGRPADAFSIMRNLGLGISNQDINEVPIFETKQLDQKKKKTAKNKESVDNTCSKEPEATDIGVTFYPVSGKYSHLGNVALSLGTLFTASDCGGIEKIVDWGLISLYDSYMEHDTVVDGYHIKVNRSNLNLLKTLQAIDARCIVERDYETESLECRNWVLPKLLLLSGEETVKRLLTLKLYYEDLVEDTTVQ